MNITVSNATGAIIYDVLSKPNAAAGTKVVTGKPAQFHFHTGACRNGVVLQYLQ